MKKYLVILIAMMLVLSACGADEKPTSEGAEAEKKQIIYKISAGLPDSHFEIAALKELEKHVEEATNNEIDVQIFPNNQIGNDKEALEMIQQGAVQMCPSGTSALANFEKSFNILSSPYLFSSFDDAERILGSEWGDELLGTLESQGFLGLGYGSLGFTNMSNNVRPIVEADDIKGIKLRCVDNPLFLDFYKEVGAAPVAMSFGELFSAMQQGVVDGQFNPFGTIYSNKFHEVQKYISKTSDIPALVAFIVNKDEFEQMDPAHQKAIMEGVDIASAYMGDKVRTEEAKAEKLLAETGEVEINEVPEATKKELFKRGFSVIEKYGKESNADLFEKLKVELGM